MPTDRFTFPGHSGAQLAARLDLPEGPHHATALFAHCFTCSKDITAARRIAARLAAQGIAVLRFDFTGLGHSEGEFANTSFTSTVQDLAAAAQALAARGMAPDMLIGHSLGGAAVLQAAGQIDGIKAVVAIAAPADPGHVTHNFADTIPTILADGRAEVSLGGRPFTIGRDFVEDVSMANITKALGKTKAALLVMHAPRDATVAIDNAAEIFLAAKHPKSFVTLDGADHLLTDPKDAEYAAGVIATWASRYLPAPEETATDSLPEGILRVTESHVDGFLQDIQSGPHHILADEPASVGGTNRGLTPYGLVSAGLGACTSMTIRLYARRKNWPLEKVSVDVSHSKSHAADAGADTPQKIDAFTRTITLTGDLDADQRQRLLEIADKCPVHRTLERVNDITTRLA